jgi:PAS domain S-box-containing protein
MSRTSEPLRLIVFEDDPGDLRLLNTMLLEIGTGFDVTSVERLEDGIKILQEKEFDIALLDLNLPDSWGVDTLKTVFAHIPGVPIIVLTGFQDETVGLQAMSEGAQDYLVKGQFDPHLLGRAIRYARERKKNEKALRESDNRYRNLIDYSLDCIYRVDNRGVYVTMNQACAKIFGYNSPDEMIGMHARNTWADENDLKHFIDTLRRDRIVKAYPIRAKKRNGELIYLEISSYILEDEQGAFLGNECILRDVTEKRKLEEQLLQSQKIEAIGTLAGGVAHDFNNILTAIIGYTYIVLTKLDKNDPLHFELQQILAAADRATLLTQSLLAFSRKQSMQLAHVDINDVISKFKEFVSRLVREDVELHTVIGDENLSVMADKGQIEQALMNIVTNAQDAMPNGGRLTIETRRFRIDEKFINAHGYGKAGDYALISFSDTGTGMDEQTKQKIFEPFFTTKEPGKGTGLGLALVYGTVKKHEGFINVYSESGRGTTFNIYLPLVDLPMGKVEGLINLDVPLVARGSETILIADDDEMLRNLTTTILTDVGYSVITASDGMDAVRKFTEHKGSIRLVVLDVIMPKKNGKEAYEEIAALAPDVNVIFMSGYTEGLIDKMELGRKSMNFMLKPISPVEFLLKIRTVLDSNT